MFEQKTTKICEKKFSSKKEVISYLAEMVEKAGKITNRESYIDAVLKREAMVSTAIGYQVAIPHGESDVVKETFVACLKLTHSIDWDGEETSLVFMIGVPLINRDKEHIRILAMLSRHLMREEFRNKLYEVKTSEAFYQCISTLESV